MPWTGSVHPQAVESGWHATPTGAYLFVCELLRLQSAIVVATRPRDRESSGLRLHLKDGEEIRRQLRPRHH
ncbi:hypothetical protein MELA_01370 [Candidatus Methylomirabilis lanthanidiphila]|uniref:Uncharacterized protein n=1 Tax=Candidatus Methylomirabilis lanthanidiphila TaxID=2211376 RepID=A0A564ZI70_9BACT|nr:hypothetical protein MELA_01370 [Candidatus Methylomirabilis lanthanidiphila]